MVHPPKSHQSYPAQRPPEYEWQELASLIDGVSDPEYIKALHEARAADENFIKEFRHVLSMVRSEDAKSLKAEEAQIIKSFFIDKLQAGEQLSDQQIATVLYELKDRGDDEGVVGVFEAGVLLGLDESAVLKEFYAVSLNKIGRLEDSIAVLEELMKDEGARVGEVAGILGKTRKLQSKNTQDEHEKVEYMQQSVSVLEEGFYATYEFYPGINLVCNQIELAKMTGDVSLIEKAFNDAELVLYSVKKAGAERTSDFWTAATLLESAIFAGVVTPQMVEHCLKTSKHDWELGATVSNLKSVADIIAAQLASGELDQRTVERLTKIQSIIMGGAGNTSVLDILEGRASVQIETTRPNNDSIVESGFMYGETTTLIGGNIQFGGQLQSHVVNRFDVRVAHSIMEHFEIDAISTIDEFNQAVDAVIRKQFNTAELEDLHGDSHEVYDTQIKNLLDVLGINGEVDRSLVDSRTNVMVDFLLGKGDCRQHAHVKQLLFDAWKTFRLNNLISVLKDAHETYETTDDDEARRQIQELLSIQMMVFDSVVESKIQMEGLYQPKLNSAGSLIESSDFEPVEDHTWNGIITFDESGRVVSIEMADSFYQNEYSFGGRSQIINEPSSYTEGGMVVTEISAVDEDGVVKKVPVRLRPTPYAGSRGKRMLNHADVGGAHLRGIDLGHDVPQVADVFSSLKITQLWEMMAERAKA